MPQVTKLPEGGISGQTGIFEKVLLFFCLQEPLVVRLEPVDVDFDPLGVSMGFTSSHKRPSPIGSCVCGRQVLFSTGQILSSWFLRASMPSENLGDVWLVGSEGQDGVVHVLGEALKDGHRIIASAEVPLLSG